MRVEPTQPEVIRELHNHLQRLVTASEDREAVIQEIAKYLDDKRVLMQLISDKKCHDRFLSEISTDVDLQFHQQEAWRIIRYVRRRKLAKLWKHRIKVLKDEDFKT